MGKKRSLYLSDFCFKKKIFSKQKKVFESFKEKKFLEKNLFEKEKFVNKALLTLIQKEKTPCFLLFQVLDFIEKVKSKKILQSYEFSSFELWLNYYSNLSFDENYFIRAKIAGKYLPREEYQVMFPIGMGKIYDGSHIVTAHKSPDLDSTVSSFWGWMDAFAARVSKNLHIWNVPGGMPKSQIEIDLFFKDIFGEGIFDILKTSSTLSLTSKDLLNIENLMVTQTFEMTSAIDHKRHHIAVVIVDDRGYYLGDWRSFDVEDVKQIVMLLNSGLRWFEKKIELNLISLFSKKDLYIKDVEKFIFEIFSIKLKDCDPIKKYREEQKEKLDNYLKKVLNVKKGILASFENFSKSLAKSSIEEFSKIFSFFSNIKKEDLFDKKGKLKENRTKIFSYFERIIKKIHKALEEIEKYVERIEIALKIKYQVFGYKPFYLTINSEVEEIKNKMGPHQYLSVTIVEGKKLIPVGIVRAKDLKKGYLGTVSFRDFCNKEEIKISSYLNVISVIDHHKVELDTKLPTRVIIGDAQSTNTLLANLVFEMNDKYSLSNMNEKSIENQIKVATKKPSSTKILKRLLQKKIILGKNQKFFVHKDREFLEYLHFIYAILDDTDLLMKVSDSDIECVIKLLNRMKSIMLKKEVEIVNLEGIPRELTLKAATRILRNEDVYSLYKKIYLFKEKEIEKNIKRCIGGFSSNIFSDTKVQNGCCRVGQTKMFSKNICFFEKHKNVLRKKWLEQSEHVFEDRREIDLHLHMISTVRGAFEVFKGVYKEYKHKDELWIWIPQNDMSRIHLKKFLISFAEVVREKENFVEVTFLGKDTKVLEKIFLESNFPISKINYRRIKTLSFAVLHYRAGSINSRKTMISPYLPKLIS